MEQCQVLDDAALVPDDDVVGDRVRRVVFAAHVPTGGRIGDRVCESREKCHCEAGRSGRPDLGWPAEEEQGQEGVEGAAAGGVHQEAEGRVIIIDCCDNRETSLL